MSAERPDTTQELPPLRAALDEHAAYFDPHPDAITPDYLNNLYLWLPGSAYRTILEGRVQMRDDRRNFLRDFDAALAELPEVQAALDALEEERLRGEADVQRIADDIAGIMAAIRDLPDDERHRRFREEVEPLMRRQSALVGELRAGQRKNRALVPLYRALRSRGYSHRDVVT